MSLQSDKGHLLKGLYYNESTAQMVFGLSLAEALICYESSAGPMFEEDKNICHHSTEETKFCSWSLWSAKGLGAYGVRQKNLVNSFACLLQVACQHGNTKHLEPWYT